MSFIRIIAITFIILELTIGVFATAQTLNYGEYLQLDCDTLPKCIELLLNAVVKLAVPIAAIFIMWSGFLFVTAMGDPGKLETAKKTILWSLIGLAIVVGAWALAVAFQDFFKPGS
jgi:hypothetical protein